MEQEMLDQSGYQDSSGASQEDCGDDPGYCIYAGQQYGDGAELCFPDGYLYVCAYLNGSRSWVNNGHLCQGESSDHSSSGDSGSYEATGDAVQDENSDSVDMGIQ